MQLTNFDPRPSSELSEAEIAQRLNHPALLDLPDGRRGLEARGLRPAAVLVPLLQQDGQWRLLFTRRTETVQSHKGQVSFPGGAADPEDVSPEATALREAHEEVGLSPEGVVVLGRLPYLATVTNFVITPVVGHICWPFELNLSISEVSRVFTIPLGWLADPDHRELRPFVRAGGVRDVIFFQPYDGEILWGATAWMTVQLLRILQMTR